MFKFQLILLFFVPIIIFSQVDNIILPEVELIIEDQSSLQTTSTEQALLKDRNPAFQEVYLEELSANLIKDSSYKVIQSQRNKQKSSIIDFKYGSYNDTQVKFYSQNFISNLLYTIDYQGFFKDNVGYKDKIFDNTEQYQNKVSTFFSYSLTNTLIDAGISYQQKKQSFYGNPIYYQQTHYIPLFFDVSHWLSEFSYINVRTDIDLAVEGLENILGAMSKSPILTENNLKVSYHANFADWNYFIADLTYNLNSYNSLLTHTAIFRLVSDFYLGKGFTAKIGAGIVGTTVANFYGWPELQLSYSYYDLFILNFGVSGEFDIFGAQDIMVQEEFFDPNPIADSKWVISLSMLSKPNAFIWFGAKLDYNIYQQKSIYLFDPTYKLYSLQNESYAKSLSINTSIGTEILNIFALSLSYTYEHFPQQWLLYAPHKFDAVFGIGYKPVGFWLESTLSILSSRNLRNDLTVPAVFLLKIVVTQQVHKIASLSVEFDNILNQNIRITQGIFYGGFQARGGVKFYF